jgi:hypothetical protein
MPHPHRKWFGERLELFKKLYAEGGVARCQREWPDISNWTCYTLASQHKVRAGAWLQDSSAPRTSKWDDPDRVAAFKEAYSTGGYAAVRAVMPDVSEPMAGYVAKKHGIKAPSRAGRTLEKRIPYKTPEPIAQTLTAPPLPPPKPKPKADPTALDLGQLECVRRRIFNYVVPLLCNEHGKTRGAITDAIIALTERRFEPSSAIDAEDCYDVRTVPTMLPARPVSTSNRR